MAELGPLSRVSQSHRVVAGLGSLIWSPLVVGIAQLLVDTEATLIS
jgi:hypothetical protein